MSDTVRQQAEREAAASRVMARADRLAALSETADALTRVYLSPEHLQANQLVGQWMQAAGMMVWQDSVGNICGRYEGQQEGAPAVLLGSHLDTVRNAGRYDGMLGVLAAIEVVQRLHQQGRRLAKAIEIVGFGDEEGTRFGITLLGSRGVTGTWPESWLSQCDTDGVSVAQALVNAGLDPARIAHAARHPRDIAAYLELHIEQGPCLEQAGLALGVVEAINGARRLISKPEDIGHETSALMAVITEKVRERFAVPLGINVLANAAIPAMAIALAGGADFVRVNQWANAYIANEGFIEGAAAKALRYRSMLRAEHIRVFADSHVKHGSHAIVADRSIQELTRDVDFFEADAVIATGQRTGDSATMAEIDEIRAATELPLLVGSGVTPANVKQILGRTQGVIVASTMKVDGVWWNDVELARVKHFMSVAQAALEEA